jgi:hypothetical protein
MSAALLVVPKSASRMRLTLEFRRFLDAQTRRWTPPAALVLTREGQRAAAAYERDGEAAALDAVIESEWFRYVERVWITVTPAAGSMVQADLESFKQAGLDIFQQAAVEWLRRYAADRVRNISDTSREEIGNQIRIGVQKGETRDQIATRIVKHRRSITPARAETIARTEVHAAANHGSLVAAHEVAIPLYKIWIAMPGAREAHAAASGQRRTLGQAFRVGGWPLMYPGDSTLGCPPDMVVNCRCVLSFSVRERTRRVRR